VSPDFRGNADTITSHALRVQRKRRKTNEPKEKK
jgi:hypothetical protein